jgi:uncharacterized repeat protein (TIGR03803 family)
VKKHLTVVCRFFSLSLFIPPCSFSSAPNDDKNESDAAMKTVLKALCPLAALLCLAPGLAAQTFTNLHNFGNVLPIRNDGFYPDADLVLANGALYGTTFVGGTNTDGGEVFQVNVDGSDFNILYSFPKFYDTIAGLALYDGELFGTLINQPILFELSTNGLGGPQYFTPSGSVSSQASLILEGNRLYGTTPTGGNNGAGSLFAVFTDGTSYSNIYSFTASVDDPATGTYTNSDGVNPDGKLLLSGTTLFGTAKEAGAGGNGSVFRVNTDGSAFANLHSFSAFPSGNPETNADGANPYAGLVLSGDTLYGTTANGGVAGNGAIFSLNVDSLAFSNLHSFSSEVFSSNPDGANPYCTLVLSNDTLYGTAYAGGANGSGTVFEIKTNGSGFKTLYSFSALLANGFSDRNADGANPPASLVLSGNTLYGVAENGGSNGAGTVFAIGLAPPVPIPLSVSFNGSAVVLSWASPSFSLQSSSTVNGVYADVPGASSPYTYPIIGVAEFFQLRAN